MKLYVPFFNAILLGLGIVPAAVAQPSALERANLEPASDETSSYSSSRDRGSEGSELLSSAIAPIALETLLSPPPSKELPSRKPKWKQVQISESDGTPTSSSKEAHADVLPNREISHRTSSSKVESIAQAASVIPVTGVRLNRTDMGLEVILETPGDQEPRVFKTRYGNTLAIDVPNTQLRLPEKQGFRQENPTSGIASVEVVQQNPNSIRVIVTGTEAVPTAKVVPSPEGVAFSVTSRSAAAEKPPTPEAEPSAPTEESKLAPPTTEGEEPIELVVPAVREQGYEVDEATTGTRTETPLRNIPQSIQVVPQQVIEDQQVTRIEDATENVSGVTPTPGYGGTSQNYTIRGFSPDFNFRNGFREDRSIPFSDVANIERVEVLKGPASVLYGQLEPGGIINYITKKPLSDPYYAGEAVIGNYDFYRSSLDFSGPLNSDESLLYRFNLAYENSDSFRDFVENEIISVTPSFTYQITEDTTLALNFEYLNFDGTFDRGFLPESAFLEIPISRFLGESSDSQRINTYRGSYSLEHRFSENLLLRNAFSVQVTNSERRNANLQSLEADGRTLQRRYTAVDDRTRSYSLRTELVGNFKTGSVEHQVLAGLELARDSFNFLFKREPFTAIDIFDPVYGSPIPTSVDFLVDVERDTDKLGVYLQDQVTLLPNLNLLIGGRFDLVDFESETISTEGGEPSIDSRQFEAFSPRAGIVYQPIEPISLYASYSRSFNPNIFATSFDGGILDPEIGTQYEVGVKGEFLDDRLSTTLAAYQITKTNVATPDPDNPDFSIAAGELKSRGIELDVTGEILPGWNIIASYAYTDAFVSEDNDLPVGDRLPNVPYNSASLWTTYEIQAGSLQGLGFGAGLFFYSDREAALPNTITLPSYLRTDVSVFYQRNNWKAGLNIKNLFDVESYSSDGSRIYPGEPLTVLGSVSVEF
ncbi:MAG: TonB-dependent siderophore receptor [Cyanobacteria bacterium QH_9_48_43]|nr:MAG: TonB-dependent siderophore receptor [Cyanobacteria bacterium QH_9_48_43]